MKRSARFLTIVAAGGIAPCGAPPDAGGPLWRLSDRQATDRLGGLAREPMIVQTADGALFVTGYGEGRPLLWRSDDRGNSWDSVYVGTEAEGAIGNSDVDLALGPDGTLYFVTMSFDRDSFEGLGIAIGSSRDGGATWSWASLSSDRFDDRPWVEVAPDGTAHVIWNDGSGVAHAVSTDRGLTWTERPRIRTLGGSSHMAIGPTGTIAVRVTPLSASGNRHDPGVDELAISTDGGATWLVRQPPGTRTWNPTFDPSQGLFRWVEPLAWDEAGALYHLWSEGRTMHVARSTDDGTTWTQWTVASDTVDLYFPYLAARGDGVLAATWYAGYGDALRGHLAYIVLRDGEPTVVRADPFAIPAFNEQETGEPIRDTAGEYIPLMFLDDGSLAVVTTIQDPVGKRWGFTYRPYLPWIGEIPGR
jgi:hypothetical protein